MLKYLKKEWAFFFDERGSKKYNELCRKCGRSCKQSFRATVILYPNSDNQPKRVEIPDAAGCKSLPKSGKQPKKVEIPRVAGCKSLPKQ